VTVNSNFIGVT